MWEIFSTLFIVLILVQSILFYWPRFTSSSSMDTSVSSTLKLPSQTIAHEYQFLKQEYPLKNASTEKEEYISHGYDTDNT
jgi:hypothetical protein